MALQYLLVSLLAYRPPVIATSLSLAASQNLYRAQSQWVSAGISLHKLRVCTSLNYPAEVSLVRFLLTPVLHCIRRSLSIYAKANQAQSPTIMQWRIGEGSHERTGAVWTRSVDLQSYNSAAAIARTERFNVSHDSTPSPHLPTFSRNATHANFTRS